MEYVGIMPVTKIDDKGRVLLPKELREELRLRPKDELVIDRIDDLLVLKRVNLKMLLEAAIEKVKSVDMDALESEISRESNRLAREKYKISD